MTLFDQSEGTIALTYLAWRVLLSAVLIVVVAEIADKERALGAPVASLPLVSLLGMVWIWKDTQDPARLADHA